MKCDADRSHMARDDVIVVYTCLVLLITLVLWLSLMRTSSVNDVSIVYDDKVNKTVPLPQ